MCLQNKIKADITFATFILFSFVALVGFIYGISDVKLEYERVLDFIAILFFPFVLLFSYLNLQNPYILLLFLGLNNLLYSYFFIKLFARKLPIIKKYKPFNLTHITAYVIPSVILIRFVFIIVKSWGINIVHLFLGMDSVDMNIPFFSYN